MTNNTITTAATKRANFRNARTWANTKAAKFFKKFILSHTAEVCDGREERPPRERLLGSCQREDIGPLAEIVAKVLAIMIHRGTHSRTGCGSSSSAARCKSVNGH